MSTSIVTIVVEVTNRNSETPDRGYIWDGIKTLFPGDIVIVKDIKVEAAPEATREELVAMGFSPADVREEMERRTPGQCDFATCGCHTILGEPIAERDQPSISRVPMTLPRKPR
jgi:hypothetical protein